MSQLVLLRHGQSLFNQQERYAGWRDVELSPLGREQALEAGRLMATAGLGFDLAYASWLGRARETLRLALLGMGGPEVPRADSWRLNERHCGALEGLGKAEARELFGEPVIQAWRERLHAPPPLLSRDDPRHPARDPRYAGLDAADLPAGESLAHLLERLRPFWRDDLRPRLLGGQRVLVVGHGVCLWALARLLTGQDLPAFVMPNANPLVIDLSMGREIKSLRYLDPLRANLRP